MTPYVMRILHNSFIELLNTVHSICAFVEEVGLEPTTRFFLGVLLRPALLPTELLLRFAYISLYVGLKHVILMNSMINSHELLCIW